MQDLWEDFKRDKALTAPQHIVVGTEAIPTNDKPNMSMEKNKKGRLSARLLFPHGTCGLLGWNPIADGSVLALPAPQQMMEAAE
jgi:hypothetical protein